MLSGETISCVNLSSIIEMFVDEDHEDAFLEYIGQGHSWGDAWYTLIGNNQMFHYLLEFLDSIKMPMTDEQQDEYWAQVGYDNYVNLEA